MRLLLRQSRPRPCPQVEPLESRRLLSSLADYLGPWAGTSGLTYTPFSDGMALEDDARRADLSNWHPVAGAPPQSVDDDPSLTHEPYMQLAGGLVRAELNQTATQDFTLSARAIHGSYANAMFIGVFDASGRKGYSVYWDSALSTQFGGQGWVQVRKFDLVGEVTAADWGTAIGPQTASGHRAVIDALNASFATIQLSWDRTAGQLKVIVDGVQRLAVSDPGFAEPAFTRVYFNAKENAGRGGSFDDVQLTIGRKLQELSSGGATYVDDRFNAPNRRDLSLLQDPADKPDQRWTMLSGTAAVIEEPYDPADASSTPERRLRMFGDGTRLVTPIATVLGDSSAEPLINISYDISRIADSGDSGGIFLVDATGKGFGFVTELAADSSNRISLQLHTTTDFAATSTSVGLPVNFGGLSGEANHIVSFEWDRLSGVVNATVDGRPSLAFGSPVALEGFSHAVAWSYGSSIALDNVLVSSVPAGAIHLDSYAPAGDGVTDDRNKLLAAVTAAQSSASKVLYLGPGTFLHSGTIPVTSIKVIGVGGATALKRIDANYGALQLNGTGAAARRMRLLSPGAERVSAYAAAGVAIYGIDCAVTDVQVQGVETGQGAGSAGILIDQSDVSQLGNSNVVNNVVLHSYADATHTTGGTVGLQIYNNAVRQCGDDSYPVVSYVNQGVVCSEIAIFNNIGQDQIWARGLVVVGGSKIRFEGNYIRNAAGSGIHVASESSYNTFGGSEILFRRNYIDSPRGLAKDGDGSLVISLPAVLVSGRSGYATMDVTIAENTIVNGGYRALVVSGAATSDVIIRANRFIESHGAPAVLFTGSARDIEFTGNRLSETAGAGVSVDTGVGGRLAIDDNHFWNINSSGNSAADVIYISSAAAVSSLSVTGNLYENIGVAYGVNRYIESAMPSTRAFIGGNVTTTGEPASYAGLPTNHPPATSGESFSISQRSPAGTAVGTVTGSDANAGQTLSYWFYSNGPLAIASGDEDGAFAIDSATGLITVADPSRLVEGTRTILVRVRDSAAYGDLSNLSRVTITILDDTAPELTSFQVEGGSHQRSMVRSLRLGFSEPVLFVPAMVRLETSRGRAVPGVEVRSADLFGDGFTWELTFSGPAVVGESLPDGLYRVVFTAQPVRDRAGNALGPVSPQAFHRLFGDIDGDRQVRAMELRMLARAMREYDSDLDFDADGVIDSFDLLCFRQRMSRPRL